ncbi:MAG: hypothetical protein P0107_08965 [Nitrosomonas sp.]|nr:hypothetical protein [Nitrosomonas sp.]
MMTFFLINVAAGVTAQGDKGRYCRIFRPLKVALLGGDGSGDSTSVVKVVEMISAKNRQIEAINFDDLKRSIDMDALRHFRIASKARQLEKTQARIEDAINSNPALNKFKSQFCSILLEGRVSNRRERTVSCLHGQSEQPQNDPA